MVLDEKSAEKSFTSWLLEGPEYIRLKLIFQSDIHWCSF